MEHKSAGRCGFPLLRETLRHLRLFTLLAPGLEGSLEGRVILIVFLRKLAVTENSHDSDGWTISDGAGHMCVDG